MASIENLISRRYVLKYTKNVNGIDKNTSQTLNKIKQDITNDSYVALTEKLSTLMDTPYVEGNRVDTYIIASDGN